MERQIGSRQLLNIIAFFLIVQFGGFLLTIVSLPISQLQEVQAASNVATPLNTYNISVIIIELIVITVVIMYLLKKFSGDLLALLLDALFIIPGSTLTILVILNILFPALDGYYSFLAALIIGILLVLAKRKNPKIRNFVVVTYTLGFGLLFGILGFKWIYVLMALIAIYDYVAVFITKHMITLANMASQKNLALFVSSSDVHMVPNEYVSKKERIEIKRSGIQKKIKDQTIKRFMSRGNTPYISSVGLGGGDLLLPLMLATSAYVSFSSFFVPVFIIIGSTAGVIATLLILKKYKVALPAIPPIFAFENLFLGFIFLFFQPNIQLSLSFLLVFIVIMMVMHQTLKKGVKQPPIQRV